MSVGNEQSELFLNLTEDAKQLCKVAHSVLRFNCDLIVAGDVTMKKLKDICTKKGKVQQLCAEAAIDFNLEKWLGHFEAVVAYNEKVQKFHSLLTSKVKGKLEDFIAVTLLSV